MRKNGALGRRRWARWQRRGRRYGQGSEVGGGIEAVEGVETGRVRGTAKAMNKNRRKRRALVGIEEEQRRG